MDITVVVANHTKELMRQNDVSNMVMKQVQHLNNENDRRVKQVRGLIVVCTALFLMNISLISLLVIYIIRKGW